MPGLPPIPGIPRAPLIGRLSAILRHWVGQPGAAYSIRRVRNVEAKSGSRGESGSATPAAVGSRGVAQRQSAHCPYGLEPVSSTCETGLHQRPILGCRKMASGGGDLAAHGRFKHARFRSLRHGIFLAHRQPTEKTTISWRSGRVSVSRGTNCCSLVVSTGTWQVRAWRPGLGSRRTE
jgi:hypothetical protein